MVRNTSISIVSVMGCLLLMWTQISAQTTTVDEQVYFSTGSWELDSKARHILDSIVAHGENQVIKGVKVAGHTDAVGSDEANYELSKKRALTVARYLRDFGINAKVVKLSAFGEDRAVANNNTASGRKLNRRVELRVYLGQMKNPTPPIADGGDGDDALLGDDQDGVVEGNIGNYDCEKGLQMKGRRGVMIDVPGGTFEDCEGLGITVQLSEFTLFENVVGKNVSTMAGDTLLESAGMICLTAFADEKQLARIRQGEYITVKVPAERFDPGMQLYFSDQSRDVSDITWTSVPSAPVAFDEEENCYVFKTNDLSCINLDKPAIDTMAMPVAIRVKRRMLKNSNLYVAYQDRGTFTQGRLKGRDYIVFGSVPFEEDVRLKGFLSNGRTLYRIDKKLSAEKRREKTVDLEGQTYQLIAKVNRRGVGRKDNFVTRKNYFRPGYEAFGAVGK